MTIGEVARRAGLRASAIRYYEKAGVLPPAVRSGGQRRYNAAILERLAVLERAKACGFSLEEARRLFFGFAPQTTPQVRWKTLARRKLAELETLERQISARKRLLRQTCNCPDLGECGRRLRERGSVDVAKDSPQSS